jgi:hypothetical protein
MDRRVLSQPLSMRSGCAERRRVLHDGRIVERTRRGGDRCATVSALAESWRDAWSMAANGWPAIMFGDPEALRLREVA